MTNVIIYLVATIGASIQVYHAMMGTLWWSPNDPMPMIALIGVLLMALGTAWSAVRGTSAAWIVFIGALFCWAFYIPAMGNLFAGMGQSITEGRLAYSSVDVYLPLIAPLFLFVATVTALLNGPLGKTSG